MKQDTDAISKNIDGIWADDLLGRREDAEFLKTFLANRADEYGARKIAQSYVLNLNAEWGQGKTFFLDRFADSLRTWNFPVAMINAWRDDHADDPLLAVMAGISKTIESDKKFSDKTKSKLRSLGRLTGQIVAAGAKGAIKTAGKKIIGEELDEVSRLFTRGISEAASEGRAEIGATLNKMFDEQAEALLGRFEASQNTIEKFKLDLRKFSRDVAKEKQTPIFVLIDELDRCRPSYAVKLLERIKHLFDLGGFVFVIATDTEQLQHAVGAVYGVGFDGLRYLARFFNHTYRFEPPPKSVLVSELIQRAHLSTKKISLPPNASIEDYISGGCNYCGLSLRDIEQIIDLLASATTAWNLPVELEISVLLPLVILQQQRRPLSNLANISDQIGELHNKYRGDPDAWHVRFTRNGGFSRGIETEYINGQQLLREFVARAEKDLTSIDTATTSMHSNWAVTRFQREFSQLHNNTFIPGNPVNSVICDYLTLVRSAGRIVPTKDT